MNDTVSGSRAILLWAGGCSLPSASLCHTTHCPPPVYACPLKAWHDAQPPFTTHVLGPHFEEIAREFTFRFASPDTVGGNAGTIAPAVVNDPRRRTQHELDVVALGRDHTGSSQVLALGEAKHTDARRTLGDITRLEQIRTLVAAKHPSAAQAHLLLFSANGFDPNLTRAATTRPDVELIDLDRLYHGS